MISFLGCESKKSYNISSDPMLTDLVSRITTMETELTSLRKELGEVRKVLKTDEDEIDFELRNSLKKELLEGDVHEKSGVLRDSRCGVRMEVELEQPSIILSPMLSFARIMVAG